MIDWRSPWAWVTTGIPAIAFWAHLALQGAFRSVRALQTEVLPLMVALVVLSLLYALRGGSKGLDWRLILIIVRANLAAFANRFAKLS